jgi:mono/diheme cytochrome c family protein
MDSSILRAGVTAFFAILASNAFAQDPNGVFSASGCGACHGEEGGGGMLAPSIATGELALAEFIDYVRSPTGRMPAYAAENVSDQSLGEIHAYLENLPGSALLQGNAERGATLFRQKGCFQCHANEGQGGAQGPRIGPEPPTLARFSWYIRNPSGGMPPYTAVVITDQELADIHAFLESRPQPAAVEDIPLLAP